MTHKLTLICLLLLAGCLEQPAPKPIEPEPPKPVEPIPTPTPDPINDAPLTVAMPASLLATLNELLGDRGSITFTPAAPVKIVRSDVSLTLPVGMSCEFTLTADRGLLTFKEPRPQVEAKAIGLKLTPHLTKVELLPDNTGIATVQGTLYTKRQRFDLRPLGEPETVQDNTSAITVRPVVTFYTAPWCKHCEHAKTDLHAAQAAGLLPFDLKEETMTFPEWLFDDPKNGLPLLYWSAEGKWWKYVGWSGLDNFLKSWNRSQGKPKK